MISSMAGVLIPIIVVSWWFSPTAVVKSVLKRNYCNHAVDSPKNYRLLEVLAASWHDGPMNIESWAVFHVNCCVAQLVVDPHLVELGHCPVTHRLPWGGIALTIARKLIDRNAELNQSQHHLEIFVNIEAWRGLLVKSLELTRNPGLEWNRIISLNLEDKSCENGTRGWSIK